MSEEDMGWLTRLLCSSSFMNCDLTTLNAIHSTMNENKSQSRKEWRRRQSVFKSTTNRSDDVSMRLSQREWRTGCTTLWNSIVGRSWERWPFLLRFSRRRINNPERPCSSHSVVEINTACFLSTLLGICFSYVCTQNPPQNLSPSLWPSKHKTYVWGWQNLCYWCISQNHCGVFVTPGYMMILRTSYKLIIIKDHNPYDIVIYECMPVIKSKCRIVIIKC